MTSKAGSYNIGLINMVADRTSYTNDDDNLIGNFLMHFIHTPGSDLFLVFNEELDTSIKHIDLTNRVLLLKFNYLLNFL